MVHPEAISSAEKREKGKHVWFLPPSPWQREMDVNLGLGVQPSESWRTSPARRSQGRTHGTCVWQWHLKKNHSEACARPFNCRGHGPSFFPTSNGNGWRKLVFFFFFSCPLSPYWMSDSHFTVFTNYENSGDLITNVMRSRRRRNHWSRLRQRTDCKVLEKWAARPPHLPLNPGIPACCNADLKPQRKKSTLGEE